MKSQPQPALPVAQSSANPARTWPACLICGSTAARVVDVFPAEEIRQAWSVFSVRFSKPTWKIFDRVAEVELFECLGCGFRYCDPRLAGDGEFYSELERQKNAYYPPEVPEFTRT